MPYPSYSSSSSSTATYSTYSTTTPSAPRTSSSTTSGAAAPTHTHTHTLTLTPTLSLHHARKAAPTCTLSLAHVSAAPFAARSNPDMGTLNAKAEITLDLRVDFDFSTVISVPVPVQVQVVDAGRGQAQGEPKHAFLAHPPPPHVHGSSRRMKARKRGVRRGGDINCIPFPTAPAASPLDILDSTSSVHRHSSSSSSSSSSSTTSLRSSISSTSSQTSYSSFSSSSSPPNGAAPHVLLRASANVAQAQPQAPQRARKSTIHPASLPALRASLRGNASATPSTPVQQSPLPQRMQALRGPALASGVAVQRTTNAGHPERPSSPTPDAEQQQQQQMHHLSLAALASLLQDAKQQQLKKEGGDEIFDPPPYTSPPPPYTASPSRSPSPSHEVKRSEPIPIPVPAAPAAPRPLPQVCVSAATPVVAPVPIKPKASRTPTPIAVKLSAPAASSRSNSLSAYNQPPRRQRIASSDLRVLVYLYRTVMYGVERRYKIEMARVAALSANTSRATSPIPTSGPRVVVDDNDDDDVTPPARSSPAPAASNVASDLKQRRGSGIHAAGTPSSSSSRFGRFPLVEEDEAADDADHICPSFAGNTLSYAEQRRRTAALEVQDALLAIRLKGFLKMQGIPDAELNVQFSESGADEEAQEDEEDEEDEDRKMMDEVEREMRKIQLGQQTQDQDQNQNQVPAEIPARPIRSSPPPLSPVPKARQRRAVLPPSYMIAFLLMKHRMTPARRTGLGSGRRGVGRGLQSGLRMCAWAAAEDGVREMEEEYDPSSVVDWYAGLDY